MIEQSIEQRANGRSSSKQFAPFFDRAAGCHDCTDALVASHDDSEQIPSGGVRQLAYA
jgi:hypothetical protein